ncbi:MAG: hypothetical protein ACJ79R_07920 [Anaeromyxobacteraceae bacterium]
MTTFGRYAVPSAALALAFAAAPARASPADEGDAVASVALQDCDAGRPSARRRPPPVEMTLPGYLWSKLRDEAHAAADGAAYALITATSKLAVAAAHEKAAQSPAPRTPPPAPASGAACAKRPPA